MVKVFLVKNIFAGYRHIRNTGNPHAQFWTEQSDRRLCIFTAVEKEQYRYQMIRRRTQSLVQLSNFFLQLELNMKMKTKMVSFLLQRHLLKFSKKMFWRKNFSIENWCKSFWLPVLPVAGIIKEYFEPPKINDSFPYFCSSHIAFGHIWVVAAFGTPELKYINFLISEFGRLGLAITIH